MLAAQRLIAERWTAADGFVAIENRAVPEEAAIGIAYDSRPHLVVIGTPADIEDLAVGFTVTEAVAAADQIERVAVSHTEEGWSADVLLTRAGARSAALTRRRTLEARSSCGLCGVEVLRDALRPTRRVSGALAVTRTAIQRAVAGMEGRQPLGRATRATHAAAWADASGEVMLVREDVGRHNALDKAVGAAVRAGLDPAAAVLVVTSRCSYEMVDKAACAGVALLVAISAPTALAIQRAEAAGMTLVALARGDGHTVFAGRERIVDR
jgi:FdhD protein